MLRPLSAEQEAFLNTLKSLFAEQFESSKSVASKLGDDSKEALSKIAPLGLGEFFSSEEVRQDLPLWLVILAREAGKSLCPFPLYQAALACAITGSSIFGEAICCAGSLDNKSLVECSIDVKKLLVIDDENICTEFTIQSAECQLTLDLLLPHCRLKLSKGKNLKSKNLPFEAISVWRLLRAAELTGIAEKAVQLTCEYVKQRKQFGVAIGSFQAVQHELANMFLASQSLGALVDFASWASSSSTSQFCLSAQAALTYAREQVPGIVETAIQLHGGIGFTWESPLNLYLRRAQFIRAESSSYCQSSQLLSSVREAMRQ